MGKYKIILCGLIAIFSECVNADQFVRCGVANNLASHSRFLSIVKECFSESNITAHVRNISEDMYYDENVVYTRLSREINSGIEDWVIFQSLYRDFLRRTFEDGCCFFGMIPEDLSRRYNSVDGFIDLDREYIDYTDEKLTAILVLKNAEIVGLYREISNRLKILDKTDSLADLYKKREAIWCKVKNRYSNYSSASELLIQKYPKYEEFLITHQELDDWSNMCKIVSFSDEENELIGDVNNKIKDKEIAIIEQNYDVVIDSFVSLNSLFMERAGILSERAFRGKTGAALDK